VHTLDLEGTDAPAAEDIGDLTWRDGALIETGMFPTAGGPVRYEEVWTRLPLGDGPWVVRETAGCCMVRVGIHAIGAHAGADFAACYWTRGDRSWRLVHAIGPSSALPPPNQVDWPVVARGHATAVSA
jgi:hypothetical protein